jgi:glucose-6-phosphate isomerase
MSHSMGNLFLPDSVWKAYEAARTKAEERKIVKGIWSRDHKVWRPDPVEISNRLGWLDLPEQTLAELPSLSNRIERLLDYKPTDVVLLGMGGSSLCPEVFRRTFGFGGTFPALHVLDTTAPDWIRMVSGKIQLESTLFLLASKSGGTIEVMSAFKHFWKAVSDSSSDPGKQFIAITDPATGLARLAQERGFADTFVNNPDVGGRYSALSLFGIVPAMLIGMNAEGLLQTAVDMAHACHGDHLEHNPGAQLGLFMASCAAVGKDKLTLVMDPSIESLGLWIEQLIAESTGKEGKGILPVAAEPTMPLPAYGDDRAFVVVSDDSSSPLPQRSETLLAAGHPVMVLPLSSSLDLGAEFFRWEFATAVVSHFLGIQPFDQPNVQEAKTLTGEVLEKFQNDGHLPGDPKSGSLSDLLAEASPGDFFAVMAYILETPEIEEALTGLRYAVATRYRIATTSGYGPRFLHSTGQYHKGGPNNGLFLQLVQDQADLPIPGEKYSFPVLCEAQAAGDYQALVSKERRVVRIRLGKDAAKEIRQLADSIRKG